MKLPKKDNIFLLLLCIIALISFIYSFLWIPLSKRNELAESTEKSVFEDNLIFLRPYELRSENAEIPEKTKVINENGDTILLFDLMKVKGTLLVYRFNETHCDACIEQHISIIKELSKQLVIDKFVFLCAYSNVKKIKIARSAQRTEFEFYNLVDEIPLPLEETSNPYFFILEKDLRCHSFFAAIKENPALTIGCVKTLMEIVK